MLLDSLTVNCLKKGVCLRMSLFFLPVVSNFFFRGFLTLLLVKYFPLEQKQSPGGGLSKRCLKYLTKFIRKHLYQRLFFQ